MASDSIQTVRSFYRALTLRVGVLGDCFLGRQRPIALSRLLFEIGRGGADVRELRTRLDLDSGYLSRMLRALETEGLVDVVPTESDLRGRRVILTDAGQVEFHELDRLGNAFAARTLETLSPPEQTRLVEAMADVERLLTRAFIQFAPEDPDSADARWCLAQYFAELQERFDDGFDPSTSTPFDLHALRPPHGVLVVARLDGRPVGCGALRVDGPQVGLIKRMWVSREVRGAGIGHRLLKALEEQAVALGMHTVHLETNRRLIEAQQLYRRNGYTEIPAFNDERYAHHWFEKRLTRQGT